jgi:hypothetical protein
MNCDYVKKYYKVPACINRKVEVNGRKGIIVADRGNYIGVNFDDEKSTVISNTHPTWRVKYLGMGKARKITAAQKRYQEFLRADSGLDFAEWIGAKK